MSEETDTQPEGTETPAPKKKAAPRKRTTSTRKPASKATSKTAKAASTKATSAKTAAKKAPARKPASRKAKAPEPAAAEATETPSKAEAVEAASPQPDTTAGESPKAEAAGTKAESSANASPHTISEDAQEFINDLKEKDWGTYLVRGIFMLVFGFLSWLAISFCFLLAGIQFVILLLTGGPNDVVTKAIMTAGNYIADVMAYLSFKTDERPFPLGKPLPIEE